MSLDPQASEATALRMRHAVSIRQAALAVSTRIDRPRRRLGGTLLAQSREHPSQYVILLNEVVAQCCTRVPGDQHQ
jgi:hypothetical protein